MAEKEANEKCDLIRQIAYQLHVYLGVGYLEKVYEIDTGYTLDDNGVWQDNKTEDGVVVINPFHVDGPPEFIFETDADGNIQKISDKR